MIGIYKITNLINGHGYIGLSTKLEDRWQYHQNPYNWERESSKLLYQAIKKYGIENFTFEILEECKVEELSEKEVYYIKKYNTFNNGYNMTAGGENNQGESHPRHKLLEKDIIDIRNRYNNLERRQEVYTLYKDCIGESGFGKIWKGESWKHIMPEVYTEDNKNFHKHNTGNKGSLNGRARLTEEDVYNIRMRRKNGEAMKSVYEDYKEQLTYGSFSNVWTYQNWKSIIV